MTLYCLKEKSKKVNVETEEHKITILSRKLMSRLSL